MEDHCIMEAISYWCMVNAVRRNCLRSFFTLEYLSPKAWLCPSFVNIMGMAIELGVSSIVLVLSTSPCMIHSVKCRV